MKARVICHPLKSLHKMRILHISLLVARVAWLQVYGALSKGLCCYCPKLLSVLMSTSPFWLFFFLFSTSSCPTHYSSLFCQALLLETFTFKDLPLLLTSLFSTGVLPLPELVIRFYLLCLVGNH